LAILSREHHAALILAQLLKKDAPVYKGLPADLASKAEYASRFYKHDLAKHFEDEERVVIKKIKGINSALDKMAAEIIADHATLRKLFATIPGDDSLATHLDKIGNALEQHIRKEERAFFPLLQELCNEKLLAEIGTALST